MNPFDRPLTTRFDESDCMLVFKDAKVPWEKVIVHDNPGLSREIYIKTAAHVISNHQSNVRFGSKLRFMLGVASLITRFTGARDIPAVRDTLGRLAAMEAGYNAMIDGQIEACQPFDNGFVVFNRRYLYAAIHWAMENHSQLIDIMRELMGGGQFQFPASIDVLEDPELRDMFETYLDRRRVCRRRPHEAVQARLGPGRLRPRQPRHVVREILRRPGLCGAQLQFHQRAMGRPARRGRRIYGTHMARASPTPTSQRADEARVDGAGAVAAGIDPSAVIPGRATDLGFTRDRRFKCPSRLQPTWVARTRNP